MTCTGTTCNQGRKPCHDGCNHFSGLVTGNSDGTSPHEETRELIELIFDGLLVIGLISVVILVVLASIAFWSAK